MCPQPFNLQMQKVQINRDNAVPQHFGDLEVMVIRESEHEWLMSMSDVATGYGVARNTIQSTKSSHADELIEGVHFVLRVGISDTKDSREMIYWTKAGIVRLGFFIKSDRAKKFRAWAEQVVLAVTAPKVELPKAVRRNHNRLSKDRLVEILSLVALVDDKEVRTALVAKLMPDLNIPALQLQLPFGGKGGGDK